MNAPSPRSHVSKLGLSAPLVMDLYRGRIRTVGALCRQTEATLLRVQNIGPAAVGRIRATLAKHGLALAEEPAPHDLKQSEVALARILRAIDDWPNVEGGRVVDTLVDICEPLHRDGWLTDAGGLSPMADALVDRARKAGVL